MKKYIPFLLLFSLPSFADDKARDEQCQKFGKAFKHYEDKIQFSEIKVVEDGKIQTDKPCNSEFVLNEIKKRINDIKDEEATRIKEFACLSYNNLEAKISTNKVQTDTLLGFDKLKTDLQANLEKVKKAKSDTKKTKLAALNFLDGLNAAQSLELLIGKEDQTPDFLKSIKALSTEDQNNPEKVKATILGKCEGSNLKALPICKKDAFDPNAKALEAINELLSKDNLTRDLIKSWRQALLIQKKESNEAYSFHQMQTELNEIPKEEAKKIDLEKKQLAAIRAIPDFTGKPIDLSGMKNEAELKIFLKDYKFHVMDLANREKIESLSRYQLIINRLQAKLPDVVKKIPEQDFCLKPKDYALFDKVLKCIDSLKNNSEIKTLLNANPTEKSFLDESLKALDEKTNQIKKLTATKDDCLKDNDQKDEAVEAELPIKLSEECKGQILTDSSKEKAKLTRDLLFLNTLKDTYAQQKPNDMKFRNFALLKLKTKCSLLHEVSRTNDCAIPNSPLSQKADMLFGTLGDLNVFLVDQAVKEDASIKKLCKPDAKPFDFKDELCELNQDTPPTVAAAKKEDPTIPDPSSGTLSPADSGRNSAAGDAALAGTGNLLGMIAGSIFAPQPTFNYTPTYNPYLYNYNPYPYGAPIMGFSDQLLFNARFYGGYGYYMPTPGLQPYSAFGSSGRR